MSDITKCSNENCAMKQKCYRYTAIVNKYNQSYQKFIPKRNSVENFKCDLILQTNERISKNF